MATRRVFIVFVLPVIFSIVVGSAVLAGILQQPDRELNMWPMSHSIEVGSHNSPIEIIGLSKQYLTTEPVEIQIQVNDSSFDCGDLYVTVYLSGRNTVITQGGFLEQCFESGNAIIPVGGEFSEIVDTPGSYDIEAQMISKQLKTISTKGTFTVK